MHQFSRTISLVSGRARAVAARDGQFSPVRIPAQAPVPTANQRPTTAYYGLQIPLRFTDTDTDIFGFDLLFFRVLSFRCYPYYVSEYLFLCF